MAQVYCWVRDSHGPGHISMQLNDGPYLSFWPKNKNNPFYDPGTGVSYEDDVRHESRHPDLIEDIPEKLLPNAKKITSWWEKKKQEYYAILWNNCIGVVFEALQIGGPVYLKKLTKEFFPDSFFENIRSVTAKHR